VAATSDACVICLKPKEVCWQHQLMYSSPNTAVLPGYYVAGTYASL
jgi:hypothetical protein